MLDPKNAKWSSFFVALQHEKLRDPRECVENDDRACHVDESKGRKVPRLLLMAGTWTHKLVPEQVLLFTTLFFVKNSFASGCFIAARRS